MTKPLAIVSGLVAVVVAVALVNTHRAARDTAIPTPSASASPVAVDPSPASLGCPDAGAVVVKDAEETLRGVGDRAESVVAWRCVDPKGARHSSLVQVVANDSAGSRQLVTTLVRVEEELHVQRVSTASGRIRITGTYWVPAPNGYFPAWGQPGGLIRRTFTTTDGKFFIASAPESLAPSCAVPDLETSVIEGQGPHVWLIKFVNRGKASCAIEGFPLVEMVTGIATPLAADATLSGPAGGVSKATTAPPIVLLDPHEIATSMLEVMGPRDAEGRGCATADLLQVSLPATGFVSRLAIPMSVCSLEVHPVVAGSSGSE